MNLAESFVSKVFLKCLRSISALFVLFAPLTAVAQLYGNTSPADWSEDQYNNIYFGAARSGDGDFLPGVTIVLDTGMIEYVAVTDVRGRYRLRLPLSVSPNDVTARCSRPDHSGAEVRRRLPRRGQLSPVEVTCYLK